jgi:hypothetical protein
MMNRKQNRWYRIVSVVWMMLRFFVQIFWYEKLKKTETEQNLLWKKIALRYKKKMYEYRPIEGHGYAGNQQRDQ